MQQAEPARKTRAIMFSDIQGYSKLMGEDEPLALKLLEEHNSICVPHIQRHRGQILKFIGDAILSAFESATDAVQCAVELQRMLAERNGSRPDIVPLVIRIGIHIGDVVFKDGDVFGDGVNVAARIEPLAEPGGVAISQTVYDMIKARPEIQTVNLGGKELKNIKEAVNIYKVLIEAQGPRRSFAAPRSALIAAGLLGLAAAGLFVLKNAGFSAKSIRLPAVPGQKPAAEWDRYAERHRHSPEEQQKRVEERDTAWWQHLRPLLISNQVPQADKERFAEQFYQEYHEFPGLHLGTVGELLQYLPAGPDRSDVEALAKSPAAREAVVRMTIKQQATKACADSMTFADPEQRKEFLNKNAINRTGNFVDVKDGEPAKDRSGNATFRYKSASGRQRDVPMSYAIFSDGPQGQAAVAKAAQDLAKDFLNSAKTAR